MHLGQRVYAQTNEINFHRWYECKITDIRRKKRSAEQGNVLYCILDVLTCCKTLPWEYVVEFQDGSTLALPRERIQEKL
jgi:hypothetical protein